MTRRCSLKEAFIENQLDKFQPGWRNGENIRAETKQKIREYVSTKMPEDLMEPGECITEYSIWHMAKKIRERENLPKPKRSNEGKKVSECKPCEEKVMTQGPQKKYRLRPLQEASVSNPVNEQLSEFVSADPSIHAILVKVLRELLQRYGFKEFMAALFVIGNEMETLEEEADTQGAGDEKGDL